MEQLLPALLTSCKRQNIKKRTILLYQGEVPRCGYILLSGSMKKYRVNKYGEEQIVGFRTRGDFFSETWLLDRTKSSLFYYEALENCKLLSFDKDEFTALLAVNDELKSKVLEYFTDSYTALLTQAMALNQSRAADKVMMIIFYLLLRYGKPRSRPGDTITIDVGLTHQIIGSLTGLTRETVSVELMKLRKLGAISYNARSFKVHKSTLLELLDDDSFRDFNLDDMQ